MIGIGLVVVNHLAFDIGQTKADDYDVNMRLPSRLALPGKRPMGEVNLELVPAKELVPEDADLFALTD
jgi:hypothetical protein